MFIDSPHINRHYVMPIQWVLELRSYRDDSVLPVVQELFTFGCPKFVSPVLLSVDAPKRENLSLVSAIYINIL